MLVILAKSIGLLVAVFGLGIFASSKFAQKVFNFLKEGKRVYWAGVVRSFVGLVLLFASPRSALPVSAMAVGMILLLSGIVVFACDLEKLKGFLSHYSEMPYLVIRILGLVAASVGILVFSII
jgi:uncharacterized protein YjeT (DUF2065 family)